MVTMTYKLDWTAYEGNRNGWGVEQYSSCHTLGVPENILKGRSLDVFMFMRRWDDNT